MYDEGKKIAEEQEAAWARMRAFASVLPPLSSDGNSGAGATPTFAEDTGNADWGITVATNDIDVVDVRIEIPFAYAIVLAFVAGSVAGYLLGRVGGMHLHVTDRYRFF
jgi:hypothetical protein